MIRLTIKGNKEAANLALLEHGITVVMDMQESLSDFATVLTHVQVADEFAGTVTSWFCEETGAPPFPTGTLLMYNNTEFDQLTAAIAEDAEREMYGEDYDYLRDSGWLDR